MTGPVSLTTVFPGLVWAMAALALVQVLRRAALWRAGAAASVPWLSGLASLPRRYLVDVHHVVARDGYASRMHAVVAGGMLAASLLTALAILPPLGGFRLYWGVVAAAFGVIGARRYPVKKPRLSAGRFQVLPFLLLAYALGGTLTALLLALGAGGIALPFTLALAAAGGLGLAFEVRHGPMRHAAAGALHLVAHPRPGRFAGAPTPRSSPSISTRPASVPRCRRTSPGTGSCPTTPASAAGVARPPARPSRRASP